MKTIYLLLFIIVSLSACVPTSHLPCMPSDPMFTRALQANVSGGIAFDHIETQANVSVLPFAGLTYDYYRGFKGNECHEYGANVFFPITKKRDVFISIAAGKGEGRFKKHASNYYPGSSNSYNLDASFKSSFIQPSIYAVEHYEGMTFKFSFSFRHEELSYPEYNLAFNNYSGMSYYTYMINSSKPNAFAIIETPFIGGMILSSDFPIFIQGQIGYRFASKKFTPEITQLKGGNGVFYAIDDFNKNSIFRLSPLVLNLTIGINFDYFKLRSR